MTPQVVLIEDHRLLRDSMRRYLERVANVRVVGIASTAEEAWQYLDLWNPDIVVMNIQAPRVVDGLALTRRIVAQYPHIAVLVQSTDYEHCADALAAGASAFLSKEAPDLFANLVAAVRSFAAALQDTTVERHDTRPPSGGRPSVDTARRERRAAPVEPRSLSNLITPGVGIRRWILDGGAI